LKEWFQNKSVALIGNATSLFEKSYGGFIDSHDVVVRINKAAMLLNSFDAEFSHGKRTDVWFFWSVHEYDYHFDKIDQNIKKIHSGFQFRKSSRIDAVDFIYPTEMYQNLKLVAGSKRNPTTGFIAIDYITRCNPKMLSVFGFDWKKTPTHTDPDRIAEMKCPHNYDIEEQYCMEHVFTHSNTNLYK
jgi:hypothetical protein